MYSDVQYHFTLYREWTIRISSKIFPSKVVVKHFREQTDTKIKMMSLEISKPLTFPGIVEVWVRKSATITIQSK